MKEITFLKQNAEKWEEYEKRIAEKKNLEPATLTTMFVEITDDLSYSATNYGQGKTTLFVNGVASRIHHLVYKNKKENAGRFLSFFASELPLLFAKNNKYLLYSFIVTGLATLLGVVSQLVDDSFVRLILGDEYVDSTIQRIKEGNALGIYGEGNQLFMFIYISFNNIKVSFMAFLFGIFTVFGTSFLLIYNGIMLGCFFTLFYQYNVLNQALKVVWIHGTLEISAIIIAGCAGFVLGNSYIFPGTYGRLHALMQGAKEGLKMVVGLIPVFLAAGFLESFVTRYTNMPLLLSLLIIVVSMAFILFYFVFFPLYLKRKTIPLA